MWRLIASRELRRGEAWGLRRTDTDPRTGVTTIGWQITPARLGHRARPREPDAGERQIAVDALAVPP